jgi:hypothetical protein
MSFEDMQALRGIMERALAGKGLAKIGHDED